MKMTLESNGGLFFFSLSQPEFQETPKRHRAIKNYRAFYLGAGQSSRVWLIYTRHFIWYR